MTKSSLCPLRSNPLRLRLPLLPIPLLQPRHTSLANLRIPRIKRLQIPRRHDSRQLDLGVFRSLLDLVRLGVRGVGVAIRGAD